MAFLARKPRGINSSENSRRIVNEARLSIGQLIQPDFVIYERGVVTNSVASMPGTFQFSIGCLAPRVRYIRELRPVVFLSGIPEHKDLTEPGTQREKDITQQAIRAIIHAMTKILTSTSAYTDNCHCGTMNEIENTLDNPTLKLPAKIPNWTWRRLI